MGFRVWPRVLGLGFWYLTQGFEFRVLGFFSGFWVSAKAFGVLPRVWGLRFGVWPRVWGLRFGVWPRVWGLGFGLAFWV